MPGRLSGRKICLVTNGHISSNPRIVKEADALAEAGAETTVVGLQTLTMLKPFDLELVRGKRWQYHPIDVSRSSGAWTYRVRAARERVLRLLPPPAWRIPGVLENSYSRMTGVLEAALMREPADMYIAHNLAALPAAAFAARRFAARLGFDAEDYHAGELPDVPGHERASLRTRAIEDRYFPACRHLTAASPDIADCYMQRYGRSVASILNVFPLAERPANRAATAAPGAAAGSLYWFSQTIGPGRGLEQMLDILGLMRVRPLLQIRGTFAAGFQGALMAAADRLGVAEQVRFLPRSAPQRMVALAAEHTLGLSIEVVDSPNRAICLGNKIFTYLLAGVPVVLSDTPAQRRLAGQLGAAARIIDLANASEAAHELDAWISSTEQLARSRQAAWKLGERRFNWDLEKEKFLASVEAALAAPA